MWSASEGLGLSAPVSAWCSAHPTQVRSLQSRSDPHLPVQSWCKLQLAILCPPHCLIPAATAGQGPFRTLCKSVQVWKWPAIVARQPDHAGVYNLLFDN